MSEFVSNPLFGLALSILAYLVGMLIYRRFPHPLTTPLLLSAVFIIIFLKVRVFLTKITTKVGFI